MTFSIRILCDSVGLKSLVLLTVVSVTCFPPERIVDGPRCGHARQFVLCERFSYLASLLNILAS